MAGCTVFRIHIIVFTVCVVTSMFLCIEYILCCQNSPQMILLSKFKFSILLYFAHCYINCAFMVILIMVMITLDIDYKFLFCILKKQHAPLMGFTNQSLWLHCLSIIILLYHVCTELCTTVCSTHTTHISMSDLRGHWVNWPLDLSVET